ncbi:MAG TPA: coniferyl-aldehyde dehydrogenase [Porticoccaceae bacterium]|nr:coniferyl-aldehyde dehydrogenase [Porticoccaceae bacterium]HCO59327.1 coniferyl-aldehyde dehydrogenase [Porticoccaceae bacterium]
MAQNVAIRELSTPQTEAEGILKAQREAHRANPYPGLAERRNNLLKLENMLADNADAICEAISADFGHRNPTETKLVEIFGSLTAVRDARKNLKKWMKPQRRHTSIMFFTGKNEVIPQPKGVIGVGTPWNYPLYLSIGPAINALAAGNRCMVKLAANSQNLCVLLAELCKKTFSDGVLTYLPGISGSEFSALPFDHIVYTGSAESGVNVMSAAAKNLCPVTLELGGKSPTVICDDFDLREAANRIMYGKFVNAGQTCVAPDYLFVPEQKLQQFVDYCGNIIKERYPDTDRDDYTSVIDQRSYQRLLDTLEDATSKGAIAVNLSSCECNETLRKIPPHIVHNVDDSMRIMHEEIFGPLLIVMPYKDIDEVLDHINQRDTPLAFYLFTNDKTMQEKLFYNTLSGGVTVNNCIFHVLQHSIPFGGAGASGMGHYHGHEGFLEMSKLRPKFTFPKIGKPDLFYPPYGKRHELVYKTLNRLKL